ncbi:MAG: sterol desaturase family protein [Alphaproteobacteria bacterium]|nr:sterol desaturase family protein [Alphaproteobacteria bacterium]
MEVLLREPWFLGTVAVFVATEFVWRAARRRGYDVAGAAASLGVAAGNALTRPLNAMIIGGAFLALSAATPFALPMDDWRVWVVGFFAVEFCYYWFHRWSHLVRWLWASHAVHHSAQEMTLPAALRLGWTGALSGGWLVFAPLILVGFPPVMIAALLTANLTYQFFLHTEAVGKLGPLEWILNTPSHHRAHHACNEAYLDRNFGGVLIVFDRMFGTFAEERAQEPLCYGLTTGFCARNPITIAFHEWARLFAAMLGAGSMLGALRIAASRPSTPPPSTPPPSAPPPGAIHNSHACLLQRHVQSGILFDGVPSDAWRMRKHDAVLKPSV